MELAFGPPSSFPPAKTCTRETDGFPTSHRVPFKLYDQRGARSVTCCATQRAQVPELSLENEKHNLLRAVQETQRGLITSADQRSNIEEAMVNLECYCSGVPIDLVKLDGTWRLQYTSARDVLILLESAATLPFFQVGQIFQKFNCLDQSNGGVVYNVVKWSIPTLLEVTFEDINISGELQALIAPALLPRSFFSLQILQFIRTFKAQIPLGNQDRRSVGGLYYLSYLDNNMLLGRAVGGGGAFVFTRAQPL
ncbi:hypothetical protein EUGRSUZ_E00013 [Eucalyptus grandis]|uniref:Uncharacterized protein n=2 Tax=Eucalyptus grandis TaxID=71139 RepID=A0ACC3KQH0_EUCGR|nr:hypothetical protein EUGRSUZ_E00013 [Eucalyptus grandis]